MMKITVKELMEEKKAVDLMTPGGFVYLTAEQVNISWKEKSLKLIQMQESEGAACRWTLKNCCHIKLSVAVTIPKQMPMNIL